MQAPFHEDELVERSLFSCRTLDMFCARLIAKLFQFKLYIVVDMKTPLTLAVFKELSRFCLELVL